MYLYPGPSDISAAIQGNWFLHFGILLNMLTHILFWGVQRPTMGLFPDLVCKFVCRLEIHEKVLRTVLECKKPDLDPSCKIEYVKSVHNALMLEHLWFASDIALIFLNAAILHSLFVELGPDIETASGSVYQIWFVVFLANITLAATVSLSRERTKYLFQHCGCLSMAEQN